MRYLSLFVLALCASRAFGPGAPLYWDSFAYVTQCVSHHVGGLILGRPLFVLGGQVAIDLATHLGLSVWHAEALLRALCAVFSALSAPLVCATASGLGLGPRAALFAGASMALSPAFAHTSDAVLTDAPATTLLLASLLALSRPTPSAPVSFLSGLLLGLACAVREPTLAFALCHLGLLCCSERKGRALKGALWLIGLGLGLGFPVLWAALTEPGYLSGVRGWLRAMRHEQESNPSSWRDLGMYLLWLVALGPATLAFAVVTLCSPPLRRQLPVRVWCVVIPSLVVLGSLALYQDISFSPRYLVAALPCALALPSGVALASLDRRGHLFALVALLAPFTLAPWLRSQSALRVQALVELPERLRSIRADSVVVTGQLCPAVVMVRALALREPRLWRSPAPAWRQVCPGWGWPEDLSDALDRQRADGRPVVLDLRGFAWVGPRQARCLDEVRRYASAHASSVSVWR